MPIKEPTSSAPSQRRKPNADLGFVLRPYANAESLRRRLGLDAKVMASYLGIDEKTYFRRAQKGELKGGESLKIDMLASIFDEATRVLRSEDEARHWTTTPIISLDNRPPIEHLSSLHGYERVKNTLGKIEYGMY